MCRATVTYDKQKIPDLCVIWGLDLSHSICFSQRTLGGRLEGPIGSEIMTLRRDLSQIKVLKKTAKNTAFSTSESKYDRLLPSIHLKMPVNSRLFGEPLSCRATPLFPRLQPCFFIPDQIRVDPLCGWVTLWISRAMLKTLCSYSNWMTCHPKRITSLYPGADQEWGDYLLENVITNVI